MSNEAITKVELKFCECCGGLWLREEESTGIYCVHCAPGMRDVARGRKKPPQSEKMFVQAGGAVCA